MKISKQDKDKLIILGVILFIIVFCAAVFWGVRLIPFKWIILVTVLTELFVLMPFICKMYYSVHGIDAGIKPWLPGINIISVFDSVIAIATLILGIFVLALAFFVFAPVEMYMNFIPQAIALDFPSFVAGLFIITLVVLNLLLGYGYLRVLFNVNKFLNEFYHARQSRASVVMYVFLFFPIIRVCGLSYIYTSLHTLTNAKFVTGQEVTHDLVEEDVN